MKIIVAYVKQMFCRHSYCICDAWYEYNDKNLINPILKYQYKCDKCGKRKIEEAEHKSVLEEYLIRYFIEKKDLQK